jgi:hypothetical protein
MLKGQTSCGNSYEGTYACPDSANLTVGSMRSGGMQP